MKRVLKSLLTIAMASAMIAFMATQTRADSLSFGRDCFRAGCAQRTFSTEGFALSLGSTAFSNLGNQISVPPPGSFSVEAINPLVAQTAGRNGRGKFVRPDIPVGPAVPEPATMLLLGTGLAGVAAIFRKRFRSNRPK